MIPQRVTLRGFLCYRDEQEIAFTDRSLWMLAGSNGSGKSAVFDAVTYALFGHHRGGSQHAGELINKESSSLAVEFDFLLDGRVYRVRRTLQRNARGGAQGTHLISLRQSGASNGHGHWLPVEGTSRKAEFDAWIRDNIGLNYDTFTSSVLLLQGNAEKLLDSTAKGRFEVLASIVDLEHYERLHRRADEQRKTHEATIKTLRDRLAALPEVSDEAAAALEANVRAAEEARTQAEKEVERAQDLEFQARRWGDLQARLAEARQRLQQAQALIGDAEAIERAAERLRELREILPHVQVVIEQRQQIVDSNRKSDDLNRQKGKFEAELETYGQALEQARQKRSMLQSRIEGEDDRRRDIAARFLEAAVLLEKVREHEQHEGDLKRLREKLSALPADPQAALRSAQEAHAAITAVAQAAPLLARLHEQRDQLRCARDRGLAAGEQRQKTKSQGEQTAAELERLRSVLEEAAKARQQADDQATRAQTLLEQARQDLNELLQLEGSKRCRHCGQELTPSHLETEKRRRKTDVSRAEREYQEAAKAQKSAQDRERGLRQQFEALERTLQAQREQYRDLHHQAEQAVKEVERLRTECARSYSELAEPFRSKVCAEPPSEWLETCYPTAADVAAIRKETERLPPAHQRLREADEVHRQWNTLSGQEAALRQTLERLRGELPGLPETIRQEYVRLETEQQALDHGLNALRVEALEVQKELDRLAREREQIQQRLNGLVAGLYTEERARQQYQQTLARADKKLSPSWRALTETAGLAKLYSWTKEHDELIAQRAEERGQELGQARLGMEVLQRDLAMLQAQDDRFPAEARQEPAILQTLVQETRQKQRQCEEQLRAAQQERAMLENYRRQRTAFQLEIRHTEKEHCHSKLLAELLGRDRLQLHLVRQAERQVVDFANAVLDRLSGGQLYLRLSGEAAGDGNTAKALELEAYNRVTGEEPINVAFLSGSQKFRVAVSLALGIGQYASRQHRPIESVIIDEGFGCLDKDGRQVMIQELQNLRGHLRCILLVSHQEEFAGAFADGYRFELSGGATRVTRFQP